MAMATPSHESLRNYFERALNFLHKHQWIYNYPNTHVLVNNVLDNFEEDWLLCLKALTIDELNEIPSGYIDSTWPDSLRLLLENIKNLKVNVDHYKLTREIDLPITIHANPKKVHEIVSLAEAINDMCCKNGVSIIVDVGAGLGYLSQLLFKKYKYKVLAIEGDKNNFEMALRHQQKRYSDSQQSVVYVNYYIRESFVDDLKGMLVEHFPFYTNEKICITGLHACADLSVTMLDIYSKLDFISLLIIMPCCYHRLLRNEDDEKLFKNFPISENLRCLYRELNGCDFLQVPFLRLACQQASSKWRDMTSDDHEKHSKSFTFRAIVQEVAEKENLKTKRIKRKSGKFKPNTEININCYLDNLEQTHELVCKEGCEKAVEFNFADFKLRVVEQWDEYYKERCYLIEVLTAFQTALQEICEYIVLLDRVEYLREKQLKCEVYKVTNDRISPRCYALVAEKE